VADPLSPRAAALEAARALRNAEVNAAWLRRTQAIDAADAVYVAACKQAEAAHRQTLAEIDDEYPEVPDARG
jgi:hypothetical protein